MARPFEWREPAPGGSPWWFLAALVFATVMVFAARCAGGGS